MKIAVLGAGVSGLTAGRLLSDKGYQVTIFEKNETPGGLARSRFKDGYLYDPHGGHIFNSKHPEVVEWVFSLLSKENWQFTERNAKIYFNGKYISYPFELSLCELEPEDAVECIYDFLLSQQGEEPSNFKDWLTWNFGKGIADYYMIPYNEKIWAYPLEKMETQWMRGKMPLPEKKEIIRSILLKDPTERKMPHSTFYYPLHGGIQTMINAIAGGVTIRCNDPIRSLEKRGKQWIVNGEDAFDTVISTIPLPVLPDVMKLPDKVTEHIRDLKYNSLTTILFDCPKTDITWLYIPNHSYRSHRVGYQSALTPYAGPDPHRGCAALEIIGRQFEVSPSLVRKAGIVPDELGFTKVLDSEFTEYAYVIHDLNYRVNLDIILKYFSQDASFKLLGRWGTWNYKNMDLCMLDAMNLVKEM
ncbi:FAD-dependent oxidoreductase [uncultured Oscillibacter sp.]|uniref:protoporphyrinogen/coproporphyrinogen oxidase n=1 Tax=uncultured Oscillibacter sp. TaxID=876091 RepID=UPI00262163D3|nr:FAD-dependent oxidoreductase [uncultured Oscillibacter sp.]